MAVDAEQQPGEESRQPRCHRQSRRDSGERQRQTAADNHPQHVRPRGAQRHAHADLAGPLAHRRVDHAVDSDQRQRQRDGSEHAQQQHRESALADRIGQHLLQRRGVVDGQLGVDRRDGAAQSGQQRHGIARRAHRDADGAHRILPLRQVDGLRRLGGQAAELNVGHDADDLARHAIHHHAAADRLLAAEMALHERLVDDGHQRALRIVVAREAAAGRQRDSQHLEVAFADRTEPCLVLLAGRRRGPSLDGDARRPAAAQRTIQREFRRTHARQRAHLLDEPLLELRGLRPVVQRPNFRKRIAARREVDAGGQHVARIESRVERHQARHGAYHQSRAGQQHDRQRDLHRDERLTEALLAAARRNVASSLTHRPLGAVARQPQGRGQTEDHRSDQCQSGRGGEYSPTRSRLGDERQRHRRQGHQGARSPCRQENSRGRAGDAEQQHFGEELGRQPRAARPERFAHSQFACHQAGSREQQVRHVDAGDQQQTDDPAAEHPQRRPHLLRDFHVQGPDPGAAPGIVVRVSGLQALHDGGHFALRAFDRDAGLEPAEQKRGVASAEHVEPVERHWKPKRVATVAERRGGRRHHADDLVALAVEPCGAAYHAAVGAKALPPQAVAQYDHAVAARRHFIGGETAPDRGLDAEHPEVVRRDARSGQPLGFVADGEGDVVRLPRRQVAEYGRLPVDVEVVGHGRRFALRAADAVVLKDDDQASGVGEGERPQDDGVEDAEDGRIGADAERQDGNGGQREAGSADEFAGGETEVGQHAPLLSPVRRRLARMVSGHSATAAKRGAAHGRRQPGASAEPPRRARSGSHGRGSSVARRSRPSRAEGRSTARKAGHCRAPRRGGCCR